MRKQAETARRMDRAGRRVVQSLRLAARLLRQAADDKRKGGSVSETRHFRGTCDVCGEQIEIDHNFSKDGMIDYGVRKDGLMYTWVRHIAGSTPDCSVYSSTVYETSAHESSEG
jgi:hypothetical protein